MTAQLDQRVPLPSLCRRRVWLVLKPTFLLMALVAAVSIVKLGKVPDWNSMFGTEKASPVKKEDVSILPSQLQPDETQILKPVRDSIDHVLTGLSAEEKVEMHLRDIHPMQYRYEYKRPVETLAKLGDAAIPTLIKVITDDSLGNMTIDGRHREVAVKALSKIGPAAIPQLGAILELDNDHGGEWWATFALRSMDGDMSSLGDKYVVDWENIEHDISSIAFTLQTKIDPSPEMAARYISLLSHREPKVRQAAADMLPMFGKNLSPHVELIQQHLHDATLGKSVAIALWASRDAASHDLVRQKITVMFANESDHKELMSILSSPPCADLAREFAARLRVRFTETPRDVDQIAVGQLLIDADPSWDPPKDLLFRLMERVRHHEREGLFYILSKKGVSIEAFLHERRVPNPADIARVRKILADMASGDSNTKASGERKMSLIDSYTHPLYISMLTEIQTSPSGYQWRAASVGTGHWLPAWLRLRSFKAWLNTVPTTFFNDPVYGGSHQRDLQEMRSQLLRECPESLDEYDVLVRFVESQGVKQP